MGTSLTTASTPAIAMTEGSTKISLVLVIVGVVILVFLLVAILILARRKNKKRPSTADGQSPSPRNADPLPSLAPVSPPSSPPPLPPPPPPPAAPAPDAGNPPLGTAADWLPDPSGVPDTLRYWDGTTWTQHVARRT